MLYALAFFVGMSVGAVPGLVLIRQLTHVIRTSTTVTHVHGALTVAEATERLARTLVGRG